MVVAPAVGSDPPPLVVDLDHRRAVARLHLLVYQLIGDAVGVPLDIDVIIDVDATTLPLRDLVAVGRQSLEGRFVDPLVQLATRHV